MVRLPEIWREPFRLTSRIGRLMDELFKEMEPEFFGFGFEPSFGYTDIYEKEGNLIYETELPGVKKRDIDIRVENGRLIICGEVKRDERIDEENYFRMSRRYGRFKRVFPLPEEAGDPKKIKASFKDGILKVTVPLAKPLREGKAIEIKVE